MIIYRYCAHCQKQVPTIEVTLSTGQVTRHCEHCAARVTVATAGPKLDSYTVTRSRKVSWTKKNGFHILTALLFSQCNDAAPVTTTYPNVTVGTVHQMIDGGVDDGE